MSRITVTNFTWGMVVWLVSMVSIDLVEGLRKNEFR